MSAPKLSVRQIEVTERPVRFTHPFRFGAVTVEGAPQLFVHVDIALDDGRQALGAAAELMVPKWFNKDPLLSPEQTVDQLREAVVLARNFYLDAGTGTAFALHAAVHDRQITACGREGIPPLAAAFGPAEIDKAIVDALFRALGLDVFEGFKANAMGLDARLTPDLDEAVIAAYLGSRKPVTSVAVRHTVGLVDPIESLAKVHAQSGCRAFKLKLSGEPAADCARLSQIVEALESAGIDYRATVDANEQYPSQSALEALVEGLQNERGLAPLRERLLYIEQPLPRELTFDMPLGDLGRSFAFIIDEADSDYDVFPRALALGYRGVSSKACKGLYKSLLNGARAAKSSASGAPAFLSAEDLTCQAGLAVQQDTALIAFHGLTHAERNGHHYGNGFSADGEAEGHAFLTALPDLYRAAGKNVELAVTDGAIHFASFVGKPGFASAVDPAAVGRAETNHKQKREYGT